MHKTKPSCPNGHTSSQTKSIELRLVITNGLAANDTKLSFEFCPDPSNTARLWLVKLPPVKNGDAFPDDIGPDTWELRLQVVAETQPIEILNYTRASARQLLADSRRSNRTATELLVLAHQGRFTISIYQNPN
jgi:hypothetical protein